MAEVVHCKRLSLCHCKQVSLYPLIFRKKEILFFVPIYCQYIRSVNLTIEGKALICVKCRILMVTNHQIGLICIITMLVDLAVRVRGCCFQFDSVVAAAVCLWGSWAGWTELNRKGRTRTLTARSPSVIITHCRCRGWS